jgi:hypothetical protein
LRTWKNCRGKEQGPKGFKNLVFLPQVIFGKITDLGYELPPLQEQIVSVPMDDEQADWYHRADTYLLQLAKQELVQHGLNIPLVCHSERSEESQSRKAEALRFAQGDNCGLI